MLRSQARPRSLPIAPPDPPKQPVREAPIKVDEVLGAGGLLARKLATYEVREGQLIMARAVERAIADGKHLMVEGPTGTGKGAAYLVPAIVGAVYQRKRVIVSTANIALQEQLISIDLPRLRDVMPIPFTFAIAKGRANYACIEAYQENDGTVRDPRWHAIGSWIERTTTGDVSELNFETGAMRAKFTVSAEECPGRACGSFDKCFAEKAKRAAQAADIVVTNDHLFVIDLGIKASDPEAGPLPPWDVAIIDEAHALPDIARQLLGWRMTKGSVDAIAQALSGRDDQIDPDLADDLRAAARELFDDLLALRRSKEYRARLRARGEVQPGDLPAMLQRASTLLENAATFADGKRRFRLRLMASRAGVLAANLLAASELERDDRRVYCIEVDGEDEDDRRREPRAALVCKLLFPADFLRPALFEWKDHTVIATSATLAVQGSFDHIASELGCESARECIVPSPFDFMKQSITVIPSGSPDPRKRDEHERWVAEQMVEIARVSRGRMLGLFSSWRGLKKAQEAFEEAAHERGGSFAFVEDGALDLDRRTWGTVLVQGEAPRGQLIARFKSEVGSVLLGVQSLWEGIDVPGEALSVVVIDRIPFATPDDPILDALDAVLLKGAFESYSLPRAVIAIRQGVGRLIRSQLDRGAVVLLDDRITTKGYGKRFLRSLPSTRTSTSIAAIGQFLDQEDPRMIQERCDATPPT